MMKETLRVFVLKGYRTKNERGQRYGKEQGFLMKQCLEGGRGRESKVWFCCRKGDPFQNPSVGSHLTPRNELSEETHVLTKQETLLERGA